MKTTMEEEKHEYVPSFDAWTVWIHRISKRTGKYNSMKVSEKYALHLPSKGDTTVRQFMQILNLAPETKEKGDIAIADLSPFDESKLGEQVWKSSGFIFNRKRTSEWEAQENNPTPVNCNWNPSPDNPEQSIQHAGLCDGANLCTIRVSRVVG